MGVIVALAAVFAGAITGCLLVLRRRGGTGERGALERGAAGHELARGLGGANTTHQKTGSFGT